MESGDHFYLYHYTVVQVSYCGMLLLSNEGDPIKISEWRKSVQGRTLDVIIGLH